MKPSLIYKNEGKGWTFPETEFLKGQVDPFAVFWSFQKLGVIE
jgi:hypothetical protein